MNILDHVTIEGYGDLRRAWGDEKCSLLEGLSIDLCFYEDIYRSYEVGRKFFPVVRSSMETYSF